MSQSIVIIVRFNAEEAAAFEEMFAAEVYPMWQEFKASGSVLRAILAPVEDGTEVTDGIQDYIIQFDAPSIVEHEAFDTDPRFLDFLKRAEAMLADKAKVWFGTPIFEV